MNEIATRRPAKKKVVFFPLKETDPRTMEMNKEYKKDKI